MTTSRSKASGTRWESAVVTYLRSWWREVDRTPLAGRFDKGDIKYGPPGWTIECKCQQRIDLPMFMRQSKKEAENNGHSRYVCIVKNRRSKWSSGNVAEAFAVMPLSVWADVARECEQAQEIIRAQK